MTHLEFAIQYAQEHQDECLIDVMEDLHRILLDSGVISQVERNKIIVAAVESIPGVVVCD